MISTAQGSPGRALLAQIVAYPGELADRQIRYGRIVVCEPPEVQDPPQQWVHKLRTLGLVAPAAVRRMPSSLQPRVGFTLGERWQYLDGDALRMMSALVAAGEEGLKVQQLALGDDPSGALERVLVDLYREGYASPPAALWPTAAGRALVAGGP